jgi:hypothetical protein
MTSKGAYRAKMTVIQTPPTQELFVQIFWSNFHIWVPIVGPDTVKRNVNQFRFIEADAILLWDWHTTHGHFDISEPFYIREMAKIFSELRQPKEVTIQ